MGEWTGMQDSEVVDGVRDWYQNPWKDAPSGESFSRFCNRFFACIDAKLEMAKIKAFNPMILVAHGRNFAALDYRYNGVEPWLARMPLPGGIALIRDNGYEFPPYKLDFLTETEAVLSDL
jgi:broad specificity phosphatase PhoE